MSIPFHKQTDASKLAGQVVYPLPQQELYSSELHKQETTLAQYIARKTDEPLKITFEEWASEHVFTGRTRHDEWKMSGIQVDFLRDIWEYALKNGKIS